MRTVVISGLSGAGKSAAIKILENDGFYCIDNLPVTLLRSFFELSQLAEEVQKLALVIDARDKAHIGELPAALKRFSDEGKAATLLFLEASDEVIVRRFSETRQKHPLSPKGSPQEGVKKERELLATVRKMADQVIDTSGLSTRDLRRLLLKTIHSADQEPGLTVQVSSFGFKHGLPSNADMVLDVRFLPNPFFREDLKSKPGTEKAVREYVLEQPDTQELLKEYERFFKFHLPRFEQEGKGYLHIAVGCTGGRHRSVVISAQIQEMIERMKYPAVLTHRDVERE